MIRLKFFGFPIHIHPFFWILWLGLAMTTFEGGTKGLILIPGQALVLLFVLIWHELGHAFKRRKFGAPSEIVLGDFSYSLGPVSGYCRGPSQFTKSQAIQVYLAGPIHNLIIAAIVYPLKFTPLIENPIALAFWKMMLIANLGWGLLNLAPVLPLDGGQISRILMANIKPVLVPVVGLILCLLIAPLGAITGKYFAAILFAIFFYQNIQALRKKTYLS